MIGRIFLVLGGVLLGSWSPVAAVQGPAAPAVLELAVQAPGKEADRLERFVSVVEPGKPWREPTYQVLARPGEALPRGIPVPAGEYFVFCSARGYTYRTYPLVLRAGRRVELLCELQPLIEVSGAVRTVRGEGVPDAVVGLASQFDTLHPFRMSELGALHLRGNYVTQTDDRGQFVLQAVPGSRTKLWVEAPGLAPLLQEVEFPEEAVELDDLSLFPGASLELHLDLPPDFPSDRYKLHLQPQQGTPWAEFPPGLWQRQVPADGRVVWDSLPPGSHRIWLKASHSGTHRNPPWKLPPVDLAPGESLHTEAAIPEFVATRTPPGDTVELHLHLSKVPPPPDLTFLHWSKGSLVELDVQRERSSRGFVFKTWTPCVAGDIVFAHSETEISRSLALTAETCKTAALSLELSPAAVFEGHLEPPARSSLPDHGLAVTVPCPDSSESLTNRYPFEIDEEGRFRIPVPAGCADLTLRVGDFAPLTWTGIRVRAGEVNALGTHQLRPGSALLVRALAAETGRPLDGVGLHLFSVEEYPRAVSVSLLGGETRPLRTGVTDERGWYRFFGLPPGAVYLQLIKEGRAPTFTRRIELEEGRETLLDSLEIPLPASLELHVTGAMPDGWDTDSKSLLVDARPASLCDPISRPRLAREIGLEETASFQDLPPGVWNVRVETTANKDGAATTLAELEVDLPPGESRFEIIELGDEGRRGQVLYRDQPLRASLTFFPDEPGLHERPERLQSGVDGSFRLPSHLEGRYRVHVRSADRGIMTWLLDVTVDRSSGPLKLRVPAGRIEGWIEDTQGEPVSGAVVYSLSVAESTADSEDEPRVQTNEAAARSDTEGFFSMEGLAMGAWEVRAGKENLNSLPVEVELDEASEVATLRMTLRRGRVVTARIVDEAGQPLAHAVGRVEVGSRQTVRFPSVFSFQTDVEGRFEIELPPDASEEADFTVIARGYALTSERKALLGAIVLVLPVLGGRTIIENPGGAARFFLEHLPFLYLESSSGGILPLSYAYNASAGAILIEDGALTIHNLAPGRWRLLYASPGQPALVSYLRSKEGVLTSLGQVQVRPGRTNSLQWKELD